ncbi:MAG: Asp-tRNA(Asn)/Glu-tRNA(Gln) amidotransferase subunit GatC [Tahibacter sp.]
MNLDQDSVRHIARLARLALQPDEMDSYTKELERVLDLFAQLNLADVNGLQPLAHPLDQVLTLREDRVGESDPDNALLTLAPEAQSGLYVVPKVIE